MTSTGTVCGKRVIILLGTLELGGAERQALLLAQHLQNHEKAAVEIWAFGEPGRAAQICTTARIPHRLIPQPWTSRWVDRPAALLAFVKRLREARVDCLVSYFTTANFFCGLTWRWTGAKSFVWGQREMRLPGRQRWLERRAVAQTTCFVANSEASAALLVEQMGAPRDRVSVIRNGVALPPPQSDRTTWRSRIRIDPDSFVACMLAHLHAGKDHATLISAWRWVLDRLPTAILLLAGLPGDTADSLRRQCVDLSVATSVMFLGQVTDITGLWSAADLVVYSSRAEGSPNGLLEGMAAGLPVVATDIPGIREAVGPAGLPFLAPAGDAVTLAHTIIRFAHDPVLRHEQGQLNQQRIATSFSPERMCREMSELIGQPFKDRRGT